MRSFGPTFPLADLAAPNCFHLLASWQTTRLDSLPHLAPLRADSCSSPFAPVAQARRRQCGKCDNTFFVGTVL
jgi:hypothetical protein